MMRCTFALLFSLVPAIALAQLAADIGPRGEVTQLRIGQMPFLVDLGVKVVKPGWSGDAFNQRNLDPKSVTVEKVGDATVYAATLTGDGGKAALRETVRQTADKLVLEYELTPESDVKIETILLGGTVPTAVHAGKTRYLAADEVGSAQGVCPATLDAERYIFLGSRPMEWLGLIPQEGAALRITPANLNVCLQDDRKWQAPGYGFMAMVGQGSLPAGKTVKFALTFTPDTADALQAEARKIGSGALAEVKLVDDRPLKINRSTLDSQQVEVYAPVELSADIAGTYDNPFDPDQIAVDAQITLPGGKTAVVPGFFNVPCTVEIKRGMERMVASGAPDFRVRFTPTAPGTYRMVLVVRGKSGSVKSTPLTFTASPARSSGFVRVAKQSPHYFVFDDDKPYFAVGENVCWAWGNNSLQRYSDWFKGLGAAGGNWARLWLSNNEKGLEWMPQPTPKAGYGSYLGLGKYALDNSARLDEIVRLAHENGIHVMFCLGTYGEFTEGGYFNEGSWISNPYNAANGGPCRKPDDFWTDAQARKLYKQRLRYMIARWGYSPNLFGWEFWNEVPPTPARVAWIAEMASYLKQNDPNRHLVSTTYGAGETWKLPDVDFTMQHMYGQADSTPDFTPRIADEVRRHLPYNKPFLLAEFGIDWQAGDNKWDPKGTGINMHNGAWATALSGAAGSSMLWYWDGYVHPNNLYGVLTPLKRFAATVDWTKTHFEPLYGATLQTAPDAPKAYTDVAVSADVEWGNSPSTDYTVLQDGTVQGRPIAAAIGSPRRADPKQLPTKVTWHLDMPKANTVLLHLGSVCTRAVLQVSVDGEVKLTRELLAGEEGKGPWKSSKYLAQYKVWQSAYDEDIPIEVPAGKHDLTVANTDGDWFQITRVTLPAYRSSRFPNVHVVGLQSDRLRLVWLQNAESTWRTEFDGKQPTTLRGLRFTLPVREGRQWRAEWWDTFKGEVTRRETVRPTDGKLPLTVPDLSRDVALRLQRID